MKFSLLITAAWLMGALSAQADTYECNFAVPTKYAYFASNYAIVDPGEPGQARVTNATIAKASATGFSVERSMSKTRVTYAWSIFSEGMPSTLRPVQVVEPRVFFGINRFPNGRATLRIDAPAAALEGLFFQGRCVNGA